jgi:hypothetical protein
MMRAPTLLLAIAATLFATGPAHGWGVLGHQIAAAIAKRNLGSAQVLTIDSLLADAQIGGGDMVRAAAFADDYRIGHPHTGPWHYVNVPLDASDYLEDRDCHTDFQQRRVSHTPCVVAQILAAKTRLGDARLPSAERGLNAALLIHFVADIHQPLHTTTRDDRGGNSVVASWFGEPTNLHAVWDAKIVERRYGVDADPVKVAEALDRRITAVERDAWCNSASIDWANEGVAAARTVVYASIGASPVTLSDSYHDRAAPVVEQRLARAGVRLACALRSALE